MINTPLILMMWRVGLEPTNTCATNKRRTALPYVTMIKRCSWLVQRSSQSLSPNESSSWLHRNNISSQQRGWYVATKCTWGERFQYHCFSPMNQFLSIIPCRLTDSNRWPSDYKSDALPTELNRLMVYLNWQIHHMIINYRKDSSIIITI